MTKRTYIENLKEQVGRTVKICGFVDTIRSQKQVRFIVVRDITGKVQVVQERNNSSEIDVVTDSLTLESTVTIFGKVVKAPQVKLGGIEIILEKIIINSISETSLPIDNKSSLDKQIDWRCLSLRTPENLFIFKIQTTIEEAMREIWAEEGFIEIHSPKLMATASESGSELFEVPYFNNWKAYLAQSPQFYKQMAMAAGFEKVFEIGPVFRANPSFTSRHDTEFTSIDLEISWIESYEDIMEHEEKLLTHVLKTVKKKHGEDIRNLIGTEVTIPSTPFPRISLAEAREILKKNKGHSIDHKSDLNPLGEKMLSEYITDKYGHEFVFLTDYPSTVRPFYHMRHPENQKLTFSYDLLWKGLEITTGAQREHRYDILLQQVKEKGLKPKPLQNYLNFFRYGCPPHGGCGIGLTRILMILLGKNNVREVTFLYRGPNRLTP